MKYRKSGKSCALLVLLLAGLAFLTSAQTNQLVSALDASRTAPAGGGGDSWVPVLSEDGRYVLFASTANNLTLSSSNSALPAVYPAPLNVFLRDRANGTTTLVSVSLNGTGGGNGDSLPVGISTNGRYAAFESSAGNLAAGDSNGVSDVFVRDVVAGTTVLVSVSTNGYAGNGASRSAAMTPDGRYVAFVSAADNLVEEDTNGLADVFVRDLQTGVTTLASGGAKSTSITASSESPDITPDGRYVAFYTTATNLVAGTPNVQDIYVRDLAVGTTTWASAGASAAAAPLFGALKVLCYNHAISADGRFVVYEASPASTSSTLFPGLILRYSLDTGLTDLVHTNAAVEAATGGLEIRNLEMTPDGQRIVFVANTNGTSGATTCILLWDAGSGLCSLVSRDRSGLVPANTLCDWPTIDATGQWVVFGSTATGLTTNVLVGGWHLYRRDLQAGTTTLLDADTNGVGTLLSPLTVPYLSASAPCVAFECNDGTLVPNDRNRSADVVVRDWQSGALELISAREATLPCASANGVSLLSTWCASTDGRYVAFASDADNLVANDTNGCRDIFVHDRVNGTNLLVSVATNGYSGNAISYECALSADGRYVAFTSLASNLVWQLADRNMGSDVFLRDLQSGVTTQVSINVNRNASGNRVSYSPLVSSGGRYVMFRSKATDLTAAAVSGTDNLFVRDLQAGTTYALTTSGLAAATMTPDGAFVAYTDTSAAGISGTGTSGTLYVWATATATRVYTNKNSAFTSLAISPDGNRLAFWAPVNPYSSQYAAQLFGADRAAKTSWTITTAVLASQPGLRFSADGHFLTYAAPANNTNQVYVYDFVSKTNSLVSHSYSSPAPAYGASDAPDISPDGRFVAYRSAATNLVWGYTNGLPQIFLFDRQTGATTLLSLSRFGNFAAANRSLCPVFSGDGQTLFFQTWAADLAEADLNQSSDVVACSLVASGAIPVFYATVYPGSRGQGPWLTWPAVPGRSYHVQFKNSLDDPNWQELGGNVSLVGAQGYCQDFAPSASRRFYRVVGN